ncbi:MAG TPA: aminomethyltransferase beta-barrel domain-containing protein, partial [Candidatus Methylomirabilis sp.]|nr:aminomethyltransferase beta-barrel domain-containing protein [Candidatus Methylomirabilis sp.]
MNSRSSIPNSTGLCRVQSHQSTANTPDSEAEFRRWLLSISGWGDCRSDYFRSEPQRAVAPGQAAVMYDPHDPDLVMGGGTILRRGRG